MWIHVSSYYHLHVHDKSCACKQHVLIQQDITLHHGRLLSFKMYFKFELYLKTLLKCTFFPKELGQSTQYKLLDLAYLPRTISVRCRYTHGILYTERQISVQATYIYRCVIWRGSEFGHADDNSCYICM